MTMRKRLRKKKHVGEFQQFVFRVAFRFSSDLSTNQLNDLIGRFIENAIEVNDLGFGGGGSGSEWDGAVQRDLAKSTTEADRRTVDNWLRSEKMVTQYYVGPLVDGWYGDYDLDKTPEWKTTERT